MPAPYSDDFRSRVIEKLNAGWPLQKAADNFSLGVATVGRWWRRSKKEGYYKPIVKYQKGHSHKVSDLNSFKKFMIKNSSLTCNEIALKLGKMSQSTAHAYLRKINFTRKKNISLS